MRSFLADVLVLLERKLPVLSHLDLHVASGTTSWRSVTPAKRASSTRRGRHRSRHTRLAPRKLAGRVCAARRCPSFSRTVERRDLNGKAVELLSGPGGLASFLRRKLLGARLGGDSLPLDIGYSSTVPAGIRNAVRLRAGTANGPAADQPAAACQVHHTKHKANGGTTSLTGCVLLCHYHHQVMIHRLGWTLIVNPDGTTTAWNKDKTQRR